MTPFESGKTFAQLRLDPTRKFIVVSDHPTYQDYRKGDLLAFTRDDGSTKPYFKNLRTGVDCCPDLDRISYAPGFVLGMWIVRDGQERKIVGICDQVCFLGRSAQQANGSFALVMDSLQTFEQLEVNGWKEKAPTLPPKEMTVAEVSALVGRTVKIIEKK